MLLKDIVAKTKRVSEITGVPVWVYALQALVIALSVGYKVNAALKDKA